MKRASIFILVLLVISACTGAKVFVPVQSSLTQMQAKVPGITLERANQGYSLYKNKCAGCHRLHPPSEYTSGQWDKNLVEMFPKAKVVNEQEQDLIKDYLHSLSK